MPSWKHIKIAIRDRFIGRRAAASLTSAEQFAVVGARRAWRRLQGRCPQCHRLAKSIARFAAPEGQTFFGYYDLTPFNRTGNRLLAVVAPKANRTPRAGESIRVGYFDRREPQRFVTIGTTSTWCWQQGCRVRWHPGDEEQQIVYNRLVNKRYGTVIQDLRSGEVTHQYGRAAYDLDSRGEWSLSLNFSRLQRLRPGYGYVDLPDETAGDAFPERDGIWLTEVKTGISELIVSLSFLRRFEPSRSMVSAEHYINHLSFSPSGAAFLFFHLWITEGPRLCSRLIVCKRDGSDPRVVVDCGSVSHYHWKSDDELLVTVNFAKGPTRYWLYGDSFQRVTTLGDGVLRADGHPSFAPDGALLLTDTYPDRYGDQHLLLLDASGNLMELSRFFLPVRWRGETRCDLHPRWDRTGRAICIDSAHEGRRALYVIDIDTGSRGLRSPSESNATQENP
jgi:hypothetical protein